MKLGFLEQLTRGNLGPDPYSYEDPYDPQSPWSLVMAYLPELTPPAKYLPVLERCLLKQKTDHADLEKDVITHIKNECQDLYWMRGSGTESASRDQVECAFAKARLTQIDNAGGPLEWVASPAVANDAWYQGVFRVCALYQTYYGTKWGLASFEQSDPSGSVIRLLVHTTPKTAKRDVQYLVIPYLRWAKKPDLLGEWISGQSLDMLVPLAALPEATGGIISTAYSSDAEISALKALSESLRSTSAASGSQDEKSLQDFSNAVQTASILGPLVRKLEQVESWHSADKATQRVLLEKFARSPDAANIQKSSIELLQDTVFSKLTSEVVELELLKGALDQEKFMTIGKKDWDVKLLSREVLEYVERIKSSGKMGPNLSNILAACDLLPTRNRETSSPDMERVIELRNYYGALYTAEQKFTVPVNLLLNKSSLGVVQLILERNPRAYTQRAQLVDLAKKLAPPSEHIEESVTALCLEAALVDNDFNSAERMCRLLSGPDAWISWFQLAKFVSPDWNGHPVQILKRQEAAATTALKLCPEPDIQAVLQVLERLEATEADENAQSEEHSGSLPVEAPEEAPASVTKRDQIQNLFVSGLGWAIGANQ